MNLNCQTFQAVVQQF